MRDFTGVISGVSAGECRAADTSGVQEGRGWPARVLAGGECPPPKEHRPVYFAEVRDYVDCPIYDRYALPAGATIVGPTIIEEFDSTTVVHPNYEVRVDEVGNLIIERNPGERLKL